MSEPRQGHVRAASRPGRGPYERRQRTFGPTCTGVFLYSSEASEPFQELTMADLAFVVTTLAVFALVALVAKGVTKL
ncbi:hypothetical protein GTY54_49675 [Streptomyces sp. SID625]|nr:hypothetical protein [Streptomyces sp. SID625]